MAEVSALPRAAQAKLDAMVAANPDQRVAPDAPTTPTPVASTPATPQAPATPTPDSATITVSRDEFNALQAEAGKTRAAQAQAETERLQREEMAQRLTELEKQSKAVPEPAVSTPALPEEAVTFTPEEEVEFKDSGEFIQKVVRQELNKLAPKLNALIASLEAKIKAVETSATQAVTTVRANTERTFFDQVKNAVPNLDVIKTHKNWPDFLDETDELTGATYEQLLAHNVQKANLSAVKLIYKKFSDKYLGGTDATAAGYAGGQASGAETPPAQAPAVVKLKMSARRKASDDYKKGRISWDQLQEVNKAFDEATKAGNIEYD